jgi:esterase/lipase superfamily enzyme
MSHSMGARLAVDALERISLSPVSDGAACLRHIIFAAPDIDAATFRTAATRFQARGERCTVYASSNDEALLVSKKLHGYPRAGDAGEEVLVIPGVDTIDASAMDTSFTGHSYYGNKRSVLSDIHDLVRYGHGPDNRFGLIQRPHRFGVYWLFQG